MFLHFKLSNGLLEYREGDNSDLSDARKPGKHWKTQFLTFSDVAQISLFKSNVLHFRKVNLSVCACYGLAAASSLTAPRSAGVRRRMERNRQKLVGRDKGSLTEQ